MPEPLNWLVLLARDIHQKILHSTYVFVMTKLTKTDANPKVIPVGRVRCQWCRSPISQRQGAGRPRRFCCQSCRQWDWVARQRASELALSEDELVIARKELDALRDQVYVLRCAIADVEADLHPSVDPTTRDFKAALKWLLQAAKPLAQDQLHPSPSRAA